MKQIINLVAALMLLTTCAFAQKTWVGGNGSTSADYSKWNIAANWSPTGIPSASNTVTINSGTTYSPEVLDPRTCLTLTIGSGATLTVKSSLTVAGLVPTYANPTNNSGTLVVETTGLFTASSRLTTSGTVTIKGVLDARGDIYNTGTFGSTRVAGRQELLRFNNTAARTFYSTQNVTLTNLTFSPTAKVTLNFATSPAANPPKQLYATRMVTVGGGEAVSGGWLTLQSDATSTANVYNSSTGTITGNVAAQRYIDPRFNAGAGYRHYASPVENTTFDDFATLGTVSSGFSAIIDPGFNYPSKRSIGSYPAGQYPNVFAYDERQVPSIAGTLAGTEAFQYGFYGPSGSSTPLDAGRGYSVRIPATSKIDLVGTLHNGPYTVNNIDGTGFGKTTTSRRSGFHMVGNPYPSFIDIATVMSENSAEFMPNVYLFHSTQLYLGNYETGNYTVLNLATVNDPNYVGQDSLNRNFSMMQGFFVQKDTAASPTAGYSFTNNQRLIYDASFNPVYPPDHISYFYRSATRTAAADIHTLHLALTSNRTHLTDHASVIFRPDATLGFDRSFDATRPGDNHGVFPTLFTRNQPGQQCMLNALPALNARTTVALGLHTLVPGESYTLRSPQWLNPVAGARVFLEDREKGRTRELTDAAGYTFAAAEKTYDHRFFLRIEPAGATAPAAEPTSFVAYPNPGVAGRALQLTANGLQGTAATATLLDSYGRTVVKQRVTVSEGLLDGSLPTAALKPGIYLLRLTAENTTRTQRIEIR